MANSFRSHLKNISLYLIYIYISLYVILYEFYKTLFNKIWIL